MSQSEAVAGIGKALVTQLCIRMHQMVSKDNLSIHLQFCIPISTTYRNSHAQFGSNTNKIFLAAKVFDSHIRMRCYVHIRTIYFIHWHVVCVSFLAMNCSFDQDDSMFVCVGLCVCYCNFITNPFSFVQVYALQTIWNNFIATILLDFSIPDIQRKWKPKHWIWTQQNKTNTEATFYSIEILYSDL